MRWMLLLAVGCGGGDFASAELTDAHADLEEQFRVDVDADGAGHEHDAGRVDGLAQGETTSDAVNESTSIHDAVVACTPVVAYPAPSTCECFGAGNCPMVRDGGDSPACLWGVSPMTTTGQPTCRGCSKYSVANDCYRCRETFTCACLAPSLQPGQRCCDGADGPYLSEYACP